MKITLRNANAEDAKLLFAWANEETVRTNSFSPEPIRYDNHVYWLENKLQAVNCRIYIAEEEGVPVGQVRVDMNGNRAGIDYSITKEYRGKGYGSAMLAELERILRAECPFIDTLAAQVKHDNRASKRVFEKLDYTEAYIEFIKKI